MHFSKFTLTFIFLVITSTFLAQSKCWRDADGKLTTQEKATHYTTDDSIANGLLSYYYLNGNIAKKEMYEAGVLEGDFFEYYETGELKETGKYVAGSREGIWKIFYKNGKIKSRGKYRLGERVGVWKTFYKNVYE